MHRLRLTRSLPGFALVSGLGLLASACAGAPPAPRTTAPSARRAFDVQAAMRREVAPLPKHPLALFGGLVTAEYESEAATRPECTKDEQGDETCAVRIGLGKDADGDPHEMLCLVDTTLRGPFGTILGHRLDGGGLAETPTLTVSRVGDGMAVQFVANTFKQTEQGTLIGTLKVASLYTQGYSVTCSDVRPGVRKTFDRIVGDLFRSVKIAPNPKRPVYMVAGYDLRQGERTNGFRYSVIEQRVDGKNGSAELDMHFRLETDGKTWNTTDGFLLVNRDGAGGVELYRHAFSDREGNVLAVLSAKPSEDGKFRLKLERAGHSEALESTPKAPLTTELFSASEMAKVNKGARPGYRYAVLDVDQGEPQFKYISISRGSTDVLLEEEEPLKSGAGAVERAVRDELHVDEAGFVTKEVSPKHVSKRLFVWGKIPSSTEAAIGATDAAPVSNVKKARAAKTKGRPNAAGRK